MKDKTTEKIKSIEDYFPFLEIVFAFAALAVFASAYLVYQIDSNVLIVFVSMASLVLVTGVFIFIKYSVYIICRIEEFKKIMEK